MYCKWPILTGTSLIYMLDESISSNHIPLLHEAILSLSPQIRSSTRRQVARLCLVPRRRVLTTHTPRPRITLPPSLLKRRPTTAPIRPRQRLHPIQSPIPPPIRSPQWRNPLLSTPASTRGDGSEHPQNAPDQIGGVQGIEHGFPKWQAAS